MASFWTSASRPGARKSCSSRLKMNIDPDEPLGRLSVGKQQMVEIAKAVSHSLRILILDEPTAALTDAEIDELFTIMRDLAGRGVGMIHISHRLDEIHRIADRVTVLRDGERVDTKPTSEVTKQQIINMMVGRVIYEQPKSRSSVAAECAGRPSGEQAECGEAGEGRQLRSP